MTGEMQQYHDDYLLPLVGNGMLLMDWSSEDYSGLLTLVGMQNSLMTAFEHLVGAAKCTGYGRNMGRICLP